MLVNYDGRELPIMICASQGVNNDECWQALHSEILDKISVANESNKHPYHVCAPHHTQPTNMCRGGQHVTITHMDATCTITNPANPSTLSTMPNTGGMHLQSSRTELLAEQNNILGSLHPSLWRMPDPLVVHPAQDMRCTTSTLLSIWEQEASTTELASLVDKMSLSISADSNTPPVDTPLALTGNPPWFIHNAVPTMSHPTESKQHLPLTQANLELSSSCLGSVQHSQYQGCHTGGIQLRAFIICEGEY